MLGYMYCPLILIWAHLPSIFDTGYPHDGCTDNAAYPHVIGTTGKSSISFLNMLMCLGIGNTYFLG